MPQKGTVTISIDLELAWGNGGKAHYIPLHRKEREAIRGFLALCDTYRIPCTWSTVWNLFLRDEKEAEMRGCITPFTKDVYENLTHNTDDRELWFGEDIIERILATQVAHEIGSHGFSHAIAPRLSPTQFAEELTMTRRIGKDKFGIDIVSLVYPRNQIAHVEILSSAGIHVYRGSDPLSRFGKRVGSIRPIRMIESLLAFSLPPVHPVHVTCELTMLPASYFLGGMLAKSMAIPMSRRLHCVLESTSRVAQEGGVFHLWFHPHNLATDVPLWLRYLEMMFVHMARLRDADKLEVCTMRAYAKPQS